MKIPDPLLAGPLRVVWFACGDRLGHRLERMADAAGGLVVPLLESVDEAIGAARSASDEWPTSPPLTDWHLEKRGSDRVLMAVGRAGHSHWSVAITASGEVPPPIATAAGTPRTRTFTPGGGPPHSLHMPGPEAPPPRSFAAPRLVFDIACRASERPVRLGTSYRSLSVARFIGPKEVQFERGVKLSVDGSSSRLLWDEAAQTLAVEPLPISADAWPQTRRWRYEIAAWP